MLDLRSLHDSQLDALREVANIGAGHAATALSQMTNRRIMVDVPNLQISTIEEITAQIVPPDAVFAGVMMHVLGDITGRTLLLLPHASAVRIAEILLGREPGALGEFGELEESALREVGNILAGAYLNALSDFLGMMVLPSVPALAIDQGGAILSTALTNFGGDRDYAFSLETEFSMDDSGPIGGHFLLLPDVGSLKIILGSFRLI